MRRHKVYKGVNPLLIGDKSGKTKGENRVRELEQNNSGEYEEWRENMKSPINTKLWSKGDVRGVHFTTNGWVISAIMGNTVYSTYNGDNAFNPDCEIALWRTSDNKMIKIEGDTVKGWVEWGNVIDLVEWIRVQDETPDEDAIRHIIQTFF